MKVLPLLLLLISVALGQTPSGRKKVIFDQDTDGIIGGNK
jgi:hypothetical protein